MDQDRVGDLPAAGRRITPDFDDKPLQLHAALSAGGAGHESSDTPHPPCGKRLPGRRPAGLRTCRTSSCARRPRCRHFARSACHREPKDAAADQHGTCRDLWITQRVCGRLWTVAYVSRAAEPDGAAHLIGMSTKRPGLRFDTTTARSGLLSVTGANPERAAWAHALRSSNAAVPHRNRRREHARGIGKGGRAGAKAALRRRGGRAMSSREAGGR